MKILLAEDKAALSRVVSRALEISGFECDVANDGVEACELASQSAYDCLVLDIMMPRKDGIEALRDIRAAGNLTPAIFLTAKAEVEDCVAGLAAGADDYLAKPFALQELVARIQAQTRRAQAFSPEVLRLGNVALNVSNETLSNVNSIRLPDRETRLMELLLRNPDRELSTETILDRVWGDEDGADPEIVWVYISYLRNKLESIAADVIIEGEKGGGYRAQIAEKPYR